jgi:hypothetical protein
VNTPSVAEVFVGAALGASMEMERHNLEVAALVRAEMKSAVAAGIKEALTPENAALFCRGVINEAQKMAAEKSMEVAGGVVKDVLKKAVTFTFFGMLIYAVGGWSLLAATMKTMGLMK